MTMGFFSNVKAVSRNRRVTGLRITDGVLTTHRSAASPDYAVLVTAEQKADYMRPTVHEVRGAHATYVPVARARAGAIVLPVGPVAAIVGMPNSKGYVVTVTLADGTVLAGYSDSHVRTVQEFCKEVNRAALG
ncbi:hypothetical protein C1M55_28065 [Rhodococcus qingshengii]|nr:hypothetical protein C1M55_28065 [Rhodococcus qingshengii]